MTAHIQRNEVCDVPTSHYCTRRIGRGIEVMSLLSAAAYLVPADLYSQTLVLFRLNTLWDTLPQVVVQALRENVEQVHVQRALVHGVLVDGLFARRVLVGSIQTEVRTGETPAAEVLVGEDAIGLVLIGEFLVGEALVGDVVPVNGVLVDERLAAETLVERAPIEKDLNRKIVTDKGRFDASWVRKGCVAGFLAGDAGDTGLLGSGLAQMEPAQQAAIVVDALSLPLAPEAVPPH